MTLLADMDPALVGLLVALTPFVVIVTTILQSWYQQWVARKKKEADDEAAAKKNAADKKALEETAAKLATKTDETAQAITQKVEQVHGSLERSLNGEGLGGKLDAVLAWQKEHEALDTRRHDDMLARVLSLQGKVDAKPAGG